MQVVRANRIVCMMVGLSLLVLGVLPVEWRVRIVSPAEAGWEIFLHRTQGLRLGLSSFAASRLGLLVEATVCETTNQLPTTTDDQQPTTNDRFPAWKLAAES